MINQVKFHHKVIKRERYLGVMHFYTCVASTLIVRFKWLK